MEFEYETNAPKDDELLVLRRVLRRRYARFIGVDSSIRPILNIWPGGFAGVGAIGLAQALSERNLIEGFDANAGNSIGLPICAFAASGQLHELIDIILNRCTNTAPIFVSQWSPWGTNEFISWPRWLRGGSVFDFSRLIPLLYEKLDVEALRASPVDVWAIVSELESARPDLLHLQGAHEDADIMRIIMASLHIPELCAGEVRINGKAFGDGACVNIFPIRRIVEKYQPTDMLVFANRPKDWHPSFYNRMSEEPLLRHLTPEMKKGMRTREERLQRRIDFLRSRNDFRYLIIYPKKDVSMFCNDKKVSADLYESGRLYMHQLLDTCFGQEQKFLHM